MGNIYLQRNKFKQATSYFKETLKINPRFSEAWKAIGNIFFDNNT